MARDFKKRSRLQQLTLCRSLHAEALQAAASEVPTWGLEPGFEPATLRSKGIDFTNAPLRPTHIYYIIYYIYILYYNILYIILYIILYYIILYYIILYYIILYYILYIIYIIYIIYIYNI